MRKKPVTAVDRFLLLATSSLISSILFIACHSLAEQEPAETTAHAAPNAVPHPTASKQEAEQEPSKAPEKNASQLVQDFIERGKKQLEQGQAEAARESANSALQLDPNNAEAAQLFEQAQAKVGTTGTDLSQISESALLPSRSCCAPSDDSAEGSTA